MTPVAIIEAAALDNRKMRRAGPNAVLLWIRGILWLRRHPRLNDRIPKSDLSDVSAGVWSRARMSKLADLLVLEGIWHDEPDAYRVHDFYQLEHMYAALNNEFELDEQDEDPEFELTAPPPASVSSARSMAGKIGAARRWQTDGKRHGKTDGKNMANEILPSGLPCDSATPTPADFVEGKQDDSKPSPESSRSSSQLSGSQTVPFSNAGARETDSKPDSKRVPKRTRSNGKTDPAVAAVEYEIASAVWRAYAVAYNARYGVLPTRNVRVNSQIQAFIRRVPHEDAPGIAGFYVRSRNAYYVRRKHAIGCLLADCEGLRTEYLTGRQVIVVAAHHEDRTAHRSDQYEGVFDTLRAIDAANALAAKGESHE